MRAVGGGPVRIRAGVSLNVNGGRSTSTSPRVGCSTRSREPEVLDLRIGEHLVDREHRAARHDVGQALHPLGRGARAERAREVGVELGAVFDARREVGVARVVGELGASTSSQNLAKSPIAATLRWPSAVG